MDISYQPKRIDDCFHVYSDGTRVDVLFQSAEDCIYCMNLLAIVAYYCELEVLCPQVMKTHFHIILKGRPEGIQKYKGEVKRLLSRYFRNYGRFPDILIAADPIQDEEELRNKIIYVFRNCTEAGYELLPENYPWGPGRVFFHPAEQEGTLISSISYRQMVRLFHTRIQLPGSWRFDAKGMLLPYSYMNINYLKQAVFVSPRQYIAFLNVKKRDLAAMEAADARIFLERREEDALRHEISQCCERVFGKRITQLTQADKLAVALQMWNARRTFSVKQLARLTRLDVDLLRTVLHIRR